MYNIYLKASKNILFVQAGTPIDGIGFQAHLRCDCGNYPPQPGVWVCGCVCGGVTLNPKP